MAGCERPDRLSFSIFPPCAAPLAAARLLERWGNGIRSGRRRRTAMAERELIQPHENDKRFQRRDDKGQFSDSDDVSRSLRQDVKQHSETKKPRNEGDRGD